MPKFTFIKHPDFEGDTEVTMTFNAELLEVLQENFQDFVVGAGFVVQEEAEEEEEEEHEPRVFPFELISNDDWMWDDDEDPIFSNLEYFSTSPDRQAGDAGIDSPSFS